MPGLSKWCGVYPRDRVIHIVTDVFDMPHNMAPARPYLQSSVLLKLECHDSESAWQLAA